MVGEVDIREMNYFHVGHPKGGVLQNCILTAKSFWGIKERKHLSAYLLSVLYGFEQMFKRCIVLLLFDLG